MNKFPKTLTYSDVKYKFFALKKSQWENLLEWENLLDSEVTIKCSDGGKYESRVDNQGRVNAREFFKDHSWVEEGTTFDFEVEVESRTIKINIVNQDFDEISSTSERELIPASEAEVRDFLADCIQKGQFGDLLLYKGNQGVEFNTNDVGRIDLLCIDQQGNFVVIEIKKDRSADKVVGQIQRYMGWVKENLAGDKDVQGIIILRKHEDDFDAENQLVRLHYAIKANPNISLKFYRMSINLLD